MREDPAKGADQAPEEKPPQPSGLSFGMRLGTELAAAVLIGAGMGHWLDKWLGSKPWLTLVFVILGTAAGFRNMYRAANPEENPARRIKQGSADEDLRK